MFKSFRESVLIFRTKLNKVADLKFNKGRDVQNKQSLGVMNRAGGVDEGVLVGKGGWRSEAVGTEM